MSVGSVLNVLLVSAPKQARVERVRAIDPQRLRVNELSSIELAGDEGELWPPGRMDPGLSLSRRGGRAERDRLVREAHVILLGLPYPTRLYARTRDVLWVHHPNAGASNLWQSDFWGAPVPVTTSRGANAALPIAESVIAGALMFARGLHIGARGSMARGDYAGNVTLAGKTMGVVGLGGIGSHVARLAKGLGMTVLATRRSARARMLNVDGVDELLPPAQLHEMLGRSDFVAVCVMLTRETLGLLDPAAFAAMKPGSIVLNVARGEVIDEAAMLAALQAGRLGGAYLDVYAGELSGAPLTAALRDDPRVVITPHVSGRADNPGPLGFDVFLANLRNLLDGVPLRNVIDWSQGY